jgi:hypothetical protein
LAPNDEPKVLFPRVTGGFCSSTESSPLKMLARLPLSLSLPSLYKQGKGC